MRNLINIIEDEYKIEKNDFADEYKIEKNDFVETRGGRKSILRELAELAKPIVSSADGDPADDEKAKRNESPPEPAPAPAPAPTPAPPQSQPTEPEDNDEGASAGKIDVRSLIRKLPDVDSPRDFLTAYSKVRKGEIQNISQQEMQQMGYAFISLLRSGGKDMQNIIQKLAKIHQNKE
jgi:hypothetical protein